MILKKKLQLCHSYDQVIQNHSGNAWANLLNAIDSDVLPPLQSASRDVTDVVKAGIFDHYFKSILTAKNLAGLDDHHIIHCLFLDFAKAFDSVPHERLLLKLNALGSY